MACISATCLKAALLLCAVGVAAELAEEECEVNLLLQKELQIQSEALEVDVADQVVGSKILIIGDSNAAFAGPTSGQFAGIMPKNTLQIACGGSTVVNKGDAGTKVSAWNASDYGLLKNSINSQAGWTHVWLSIGANDLSEDYGCGPNGSKKDNIKADITKLITEIKKLTTAKIVLTGYTASPADDTCSIAAMRDNVAQAHKEIAASDSAVTYVSIATAADAVFDPAARALHNCSDAVLLSDSKSPSIGVTPCRGDMKLFMADLIHLNANGYAKAWAMPSVQAAFGCNSSAAPSPPTPTVAPTAAPTSPPAGCQNNDASIIAKAASVNINITGCVDVPQSYCNHTKYGEAVILDCPTVCNAACR